ncbi:fumarylacetoacetate hydrolase family protein [Micrococcales bacterium 31B]|nr:fumarylacetoacetate hydrolase family protein [Micrococcales bacterium 31B]
MRLVNIQGRLAIRTAEGDIDIETASDGAFPADPSQIFDRWSEFHTWASGLDAAAAQPAPHAPRSALGPLVTRPRQIFAIGLNYRAHAAESGHAVPEHPPTFTKFASSLAGPECDITLPTGDIDWEVELVALIGREARNVDEADAWSYIAGLTVGQDISERAAQLSGPVPQFSLAKSHANFAPIGPELVTLDEIDNPDDLELGCSINGETVQDGRTSHLIFPVPELVARLSRVVTLYPGDLIFTGTPAGVGLGRNPQRYLTDGDVLTTYVRGVGEMQHRFVAAS